MSKLDCSLEKGYIERIEYSLFTRYGICYTIKEKKEMSAQLSNVSWMLDIKTMSENYFLKS